MLDIAKPVDLIAIQKLGSGSAIWRMCLGQRMTHTGWVNKWSYSSTQNPPIWPIRGDLLLLTFVAILPDHVPYLQLDDAAQVLVDVTHHLGRVHFAHLSTNGSQQYWQS